MDIDESHWERLGEGLFGTLENIERNAEQVAKEESLQKHLFATARDSLTNLLQNSLVEDVPNDGQIYNALLGLCDSQLSVECYFQIEPETSKLQYSLYFSGSLLKQKDLVQGKIWGVGHNTVGDFEVTCSGKVVDIKTATIVISTIKLELQDELDPKHFLQHINKN